MDLKISHFYILLKFCYIMFNLIVIYLFIIVYLVL